MTPNPDQRPNMTWFKTIKGRGYIVTGYKSHGVPHKLNSEPFWQLRKEFTDKYGTAVGRRRPAGARAIRRELRAQFEANLKAIADTITQRRRAGRLPGRPAGRARRLGARGDPRLRLDTSQATRGRTSASGTSRTTRRSCSSSRAPTSPTAPRWPSGARGSTRSAGSDYDRPLFLAMSADLAESTNIAGFAAGFGDEQGWGRYDREHNREGALLPQEITEFTNSGVARRHRRASTSPTKPLEEFDGFYAGALDLRLVQLPEVRPDAAVQPDRPGLEHQGRQGAVGRRPLRPRDGRGLAHPLRHLRDRA